MTFRSPSRALLAGSVRAQCVLPSVVVVAPRRARRARGAACRRVRAWHARLRKGARVTTVLFDARKMGSFIITKMDAFKRFETH